MFRVLIADDVAEDRELLRMEIVRALHGQVPEDGIKFLEAPSTGKTLEMLKAQPFDLLTLDIQFDRMNEGLSVLPEIFDGYPLLNILVISGKLTKTEVIEQLFAFTKNNVLKGKRWVRQFDVLDKKDDKTEAIRRVYSHAFGLRETVSRVHDLFALAESHLEKDEIDRCLAIYEKIQHLSPGEPESGENIKLIKGAISEETILEYLRKGENVVASLLLGYFLEKRLKRFTGRRLGKQAPGGLYNCLKELQQAKKISRYRTELFQNILNTRNKAIHSPTAFSEEDFESAMKNLRILEAKF